MADETLLVMTGPGVPPYSARGLKQSLEPIEAAGVFARTVNGQLINLSPPSESGFQKYKSTISCTDQDPPGFNGLVPGQEVTVDCIVELGFETGFGAAARPVVPDSSRESSAWTYYRPQLEMMVTKFSMETDEWGHVTSWTLDLEEI